jgi:hypothetical protein
MHAALPCTPIDIVGDVHGELDALMSLLAAAGYDEEGLHPDGRALVFVGDLVDRGPDSPGVVGLVRKLIQAGRAQAILGNHELNLLRGERKQGNDWFWGEGTHHDAKFAPFVSAHPDEREDMLTFFGSLPLMLSRSDLRVTHAAWHSPSVARLEVVGDSDGFDSLFQRLDAEADSTLIAGGWTEREKAEKSAWRHHFGDPTVSMPMLDAVGHMDEWRQMLNPIRVLTSGLERKTHKPFFASGQWRFAERVRWWDEYAEETPVVVGHYWRQFLPLDRAALGKGDPDLFDDIAPAAWLGPRGKVFCIDYSVGGRYQERRHGHPGERTRLALLRWPERELVFESGERVPTVEFNGA